jgi:hypothetical protein
LYRELSGKNEVWIPARSISEDVDEEVIGWLREAYEKDL